MAESFKKRLLRRLVNLGIILLIGLVSLGVLNAMLNSRMPFFNQPAVDLQWDHYRTYDEFVTDMQKLNSSYPLLVDLLSIGKSVNNRTIYCLKITNKFSFANKTHVLIIGLHHAREKISAEVALYFASWLTSQVYINSTIADSLDRTEVYIVPVLNPDGLEEARLNPWQRKNLRPTDDDHDGLIDEDPPRDIDGDGTVAQLTNTVGIPVGMEGNDTDHDGNLDWSGGVDLNRNYDFAWNLTETGGSSDPASDTFIGTKPFSEPETMAIAMLAETVKFEYAVSIHSGKQIVLYPWSFSDVPPPDINVFVELSAAAGRCAGVGAEQGAKHNLSDGDFSDWIYYRYGTTAITFEVYVDENALQISAGTSSGTLRVTGVERYYNPPNDRILEVTAKWKEALFFVLKRAADLS